MNGARFVIVGGGMVAGYAVKQLVELGLKPGELAILSADTSAPYERPPLSKGFLAGKDTEESVLINPEPFYREHGIELRLGCRVAGIDATHKRLSLQTGEAFTYERLILSTGCRPRTLTVPGSELANVQYLRSLEDSRHIRQRTSELHRAAVIGGGFIAMEVASVLAHQGVETTMVMPEDRVWKRFFTPEMSRFFESYFSARGVRFVKEVQITKLAGAGAVEAVQLADGRAIRCELVVAGIGAVPVTELAAQSGIEVTDGVVVNEYLETNVADILAGGDIANYPDLLFGKRRRVEHWDNAVTQAQHIAKTLMGERAPFKHVPYFFSDVFDLSYEFWGDPDGAGQIVHRGDLASSSFSVWWLRDARAVAAFVMNRPNEERDVAPQWIENHQSLKPKALADASTPISTAAAS